MAYKFFNAVADSIMSPSPNDLYRANAQSFIDEEWDNTSAKTPQNGGKILEQNGIGCQDYCCIEAWIKPTVAETSAGAKDSGDYLKLIFRDINKSTIRGLYYQFSNNYWIVHDYNEFAALPQAVGIRRCNNYLRIRDEKDSSIFSIPCVVDYNMQAPNARISSYVITPNNHAVVIVQGNKDTVRLFKVNTRYILNGRPFKLFAYQNLINPNMDDDIPTLLYLDLYLDEIHSGDDLENGVADNGEYNYTISINSPDLTLANGDTGTLTASVKLNGVGINKEIEWISSDSRVVYIDNDGNYTVYGKPDYSAIITARIDGNDETQDSITITIEEAAVDSSKIYVEPMFDKIREHQTIKFDVYGFYNGKQYSLDNVEISLVADSVVLSNDSIYIEQTESGWQVSCFKRNKNPQTIYIKASNANPKFSGEMQFDVKAVSMMG